MAKSVGFIGNMQGKVGNVVGFKVSQSNSGTNQGVRVYQPNINNPKSAAQAEQRAKYAPVFATYRALKSIIDRGNESKPYGNASRIAWLKKAFRATNMPWYPKGATIEYPVITELTRGTLPSVVFSATPDYISIDCPTVTGISVQVTIAQMYQHLKASYPFIKDGDQITILSIPLGFGSLNPTIVSYNLDSTDNTKAPYIITSPGFIQCEFGSDNCAVAVIVSRRGDTGKHLRSTTSLYVDPIILNRAIFKDSAKQDAIQSYMATGTTNADWAEESIQ